MAYPQADSRVVLQRSGYIPGADWSRSYSISNGFTPVLMVPAETDGVQHNIHFNGTDRDDIPVDNLTQQKDQRDFGKEGQEI